MPTVLSIPTTAQSTAASAPKQVITIPSVQKMPVSVPISGPASTTSPMSVSTVSLTTAVNPIPSTTTATSNATVGGPASGIVGPGSQTSTTTSTPPQIITLFKNQTTIPQLPKVSILTLLTILNNIRINDKEPCHIRIVCLYYHKIAFSF